MIRVYLSNYWDKNTVAELPPNTIEYPHFFYGYNVPLYQSNQDITNSVIGLDIEHIDFFVRKETSKAKLQLVSNESMNIRSIDSEDSFYLTNSERNNELLFNKDTLRLGSMITIIDDEYTSTGDTMSLAKNESGSYTATSTGIVTTETIIASDELVFNRARKLFVGRITELNNDHEKVDITVENCIYEYRNTYQEFYQTLITYKQYDAKKDTKKVGLHATAGDVINVCKYMLTRLHPIHNNAHPADTKLIYDIKYQFLVKPSDVSNKSLLDIMNWALQMYWRSFVVENKLAINRIGSTQGNDMFSVSSNDNAQTEKLAYSSPVVRFNYNFISTLSTPIPLDSMIISTFYEINRADDTEELKSKQESLQNSMKKHGRIPLVLNGYNTTLLNSDNVISYKFNRSTKNLVNELDMYGITKDDKGNVSIKQHFIYPRDVDNSKDTNKTKATDIFYRSRIKYGVHRLTRGIDMIDNVVSLETFAKDIGSILCEPDYGLTVNIINYNGIELNDSVLLNLDGTDRILYEVKNLTYKLNNGKVDATLDLKPVLVILAKINKTADTSDDKTNPMSLNANGKKL